MDGLNNEDRKFLRDVAEAASRGLSQAEIAVEVNLGSASALHAAVNRRGFRLRATVLTRTELLETLTGRPFEEREPCAV